MFNGTLSISGVPIFNFWSSYFLVSLDFLVILTENSTTQEIHDKINIFKKTTIISKNMKKLLISVHIVEFFQTYNILPIRMKILRDWPTLIQEEELI